MPTKRHRKVNKGYYLPYEDLKQYGLGSWLKENAGAIGSVAGMAIGTAIAPGVGTALGASIGGQLGSGVQQQDALSKQQAAQNQAVSLQNAQSAAQAQYQQAMANKTQQFAPVMRGGGKLIPVDDNFIKLNQKLRNYQGLLTDSFVKKYKKAYPNIDVVSKLKSFAASKDFSRANLEDYANKFTSEVGDFKLTKDEIKETLGKDYDDFVNTYKQFKAYNPDYSITNVAGTKEANARDIEDISFGARQALDRYVFPKGETPYKYFENDKDFKKAFGGTINYKGQTHDGPNGGVPVDNMGNPNSANPSALVEKGEVGYNTPDGGTYIFSNKLMYDGNVSYAKEARNLQNKYGGSKRFRDGKPLDSITKFGYENDMNNLVQSQEAHKTILANSPEEIGGIPTAREGIYIKPSKRGSFTAWAKRHNMGVQEAARHVMANKEDYSSAIVKKANFAKNFAHNIEFKRDGNLPKYDGLSTDSSFLNNIKLQQPQVEDESYKWGTFQNEDLDPGSENIYPDPWSDNTLSFEEAAAASSMRSPIGKVDNSQLQLTKPTLDYATATGSKEIEQYTPYQGMSAFSAFAPAAVSSLSNLYLANQVDKWQPRKLNLTRVQPQQINLENERAAMREQGNISRAMTRRGLMSSGASQGQLMANLGASDVSVQRALNEQLGQSYKQEGMYNAGARERADQLNAEQQLQEQAYNSQLDASKQAQKQQYIMNAITPIIGATKDYHTSKLDTMKLQMQNPNEGLYVDNTTPWYKKRRIIRMSNTDRRLKKD